MTLILTLGNADQVIQISDRRLSWNGNLVDDESSKAGLLRCPNARLAFGFTGLTRYGAFNTRAWLLETLAGSGPPDYWATNILDRLRLRATETFRAHPDLVNSPSTERRLSILFSGYLDQLQPPLLGYALLTNYQNYETGKDDLEAWDQFATYYWEEPRPLAVEITMVQRIGTWRAMKRGDEVELRNLLGARKPADAIVGKAVELIHKMAARPIAANAIGKQLSVLILSRDHPQQVESRYYTSVNQNISYMHDQVLLYPAGSFLSRDMSIRKVGGSEAPFIVPKVGRNDRCPCKSGKKYKNCHGRTLSGGR
jgi:hypothetical protein